MTLGRASEFGACVTPHNDEVNKNVLQKNIRAVSGATGGDASKANQRNQGKEKLRNDASSQKRSVSFGGDDVLSSLF